MIRVAIIGCGNIAGNYGQYGASKNIYTHAGAISALKEFELVAAADVNMQTLKKFGEKWDVKKLYSDFNILLSNEKIDLVVVSLPTNFHYECIKSVLKLTDCAIFCEKPITSTLDEAIDLKKCIDSRPFAINYFRRWNKTIQNLKLEIKNFKYGDFLTGNAFFTKDLLGNGTHCIDLIYFLFGKEDRLNVQNIRSNTLVEFKLLYKNSYVFIRNLAYTDYVFIEIDLLFQKGRVRIIQRGKEIGISAIVKDDDYGFNSLEEKIKPSEWDECLINAYKDLLDSIKTKRKPICSFDDGFETMKTYSKIINSYTKGI